MRIIACFVVKKVDTASAPGKLGFAYARGPQKHKTAHGPRGSLSPARARSTASATACNGLVLADHALVKALGKFEQLFFSPCTRRLTRNMVRARDYGRHVVLVNRLLDQTRCALFAAIVFSAAASFCSSCGIVPCRSWAAVFEI